MNPIEQMNGVIRSYVNTLKDAVVCDLGACNGATAVQLYGWLPNKPKTFLAVEPDPRNLEMMRGYGMPEMIETIPCAIGAFNGRATLRQSSSETKKGPGGIWSVSSTMRVPKETHEIFPFIKYRPENSVEVEVRTLDSLAKERGIEAFDFIWADIEGNEKDLWEGGKETIRRSRFMFIEAWRMELYAGMWTRDQMLAVLRDEEGWEVLGEWEADILLRNTRL